MAQQPNLQRFLSYASRASEDSLGPGELLPRYVFLEPLIAERRVLEVGLVAATRGAGARFLAEKGARSVTALDPDPEAVQAARASNTPGVDYQCGGLADVPDGQFDLVIVALERSIEKAASFLDKLAQKLGPRGHMVLALRNPAGVTLAQVARGEEREVPPTYGEVAGALAIRFRSVEVVSQTVLLGYHVGPAGVDAPPTLDLDLAGNLEPAYFLFVAGAEPSHLGEPVLVTLPAAPVAVASSARDELREKLRGMERRQGELLNERGELDAILHARLSELTDFKSRVDEANRRIQLLRDQLDGAEKRTADAEASLRQSRAESAQLDRALTDAQKQLELEHTAVTARGGELAEAVRLREAVDAELRRAQSDREALAGERDRIAREHTEAIRIRHELQSRAEDLEKAVSLREQELAELRAAARGFQAQAERSAAELTEVRREVQDALAARTKLQEDLERERTEAGASIGAAKQRAGELAARVESAETEAASAHARADTLQAELDAERQHHTTDSASAQGHVESLQAELDAEREHRTADASEAKAQLESLRRELANAEAERDRQSHALEALHHEHEALSAARDAGVESIRTLHAERDTLSAQLRDVESARDLLQAKLSDVELERDSGLESLSTLTLERNALQSKLAAADIERDTLQTSATNLRAERDALQTKLHDAETERDEWAAALHDADAEKAHLAEEVAKLNARLEASTKAHTKLDEDHQLAGLELEELRSQLAQTKSESEQRHAEIEALRDQLAQTKSDDASRLAKSEAESEQRRMELEALRQELESARVSLQELVERHAASDAEHARVESESHAALQSKLDALHEQLQQSEATQREERAHAGELEAALVEERIRRGELERLIDQEQVARTRVEAKLLETETAGRAALDAERLEAREDRAMITSELDALQAAFNDAQGKAATELMQLRSELESRGQELEALTTSAMNDRSELALIRQERDDARGQLDTVRVELDAQRGHAAEQSSALMQAEARVRELDERVKELDEQRVAVERQLEDSRVEEATVRAGAGESERGLRDELERIQAAHVEMRAQLQAQAEHRRDLEHELEQSEERLAEVRTGRATLEGRIQELEAELSASAQVRKDAVDAAMVGQERITQLEAELAAAHTHSAEKSAAAEQGSAEVGALRESLEARENELASEKNRLVQQAEELARLQVEVAALEAVRAELAAREAELAEARSRAHHASDSRAKLEADLAAITTARD